MGLKQKLILGFGALLAVFASFGALTMVQIEALGTAIDTILRENYRSVVACQNMKESLERMDSGVLFNLAGNPREGRALVEAYAETFRAALEVEYGNITLPGEGEKAETLKGLFEKYEATIAAVTREGGGMEERRVLYFSELLPLFQEIKAVAQDILTMNQQNMQEANDAARRLSATAHRRMLTAIAGSAFLAALFSLLGQRWILNPIERLLESVDEIRRGNLDLVLETTSRDEIGRLSESFNAMTAALRKARWEDKASLLRSRRATEEVFKALPTAIAVLDPEGRVEVATGSADRHFGLRPGILAADIGYPWLPPLIQEALDKDRLVTGDAGSGYVQRFIDQREHFFKPMAIPIPTGPKAREQTGVALVLEDVTELHEVQEMKRGVVSTVSHQLKTPLTSLRMSLYLLLEERIGPLNPKQVELLVAARDDGERLLGILENLLDIHRIASGRARLSLSPVRPDALVRDCLASFLPVAKDKGVTLRSALSEDLPEVMADKEKLGHVFANLLSNAFRFTGPGGAVHIGASREREHVVFSVEDTGRGIPEAALGSMFEPFYRAPGQEAKSGVGLGLAIVKEIVLAHGGDVEVESAVGKGSVFRFSLPIAGDV